MPQLLTKLDCAEVLPDGAVQVRLVRVFADDAGATTALGFHRTVLTPLADAGAQIDAAEAELAASGAAGLSSADRAMILDLAASLHTEERRAAYAARLAAASVAAGPL